MADTSSWQSRIALFAHEAFSQRFDHLIVVIGLSIVLLSFLDISYGDTWQLRVLSLPSAALLLTGIAIVFLGTFWPRRPAAEHIGTTSALLEGADYLELEIGNRRIRVIFGRLDTFSEETERAAYVLPANDTFDDACTRDRRSALGAFVAAHLDNRVSEFCHVVRRQLQAENTERELDDTAQKYPIGTTLYFENLLQSSKNVLLTAVTEFQGKGGLVCRPPHLVASVKQIFQTANENRLDTLILPLLGSGHGGLTPKESLSLILLTTAAFIKAEANLFTRTLCIVAFKQDTKSKPQLDPLVVRNLLASVGNLI